MLSVCCKDEVAQLPTAHWNTCDSEKYVLKTKTEHHDEWSMFGDAGAQNSFMQNNWRMKSMISIIYLLKSESL